MRFVIKHFGFIGIFLCFGAVLAVSPKAVAEKLKAPRSVRTKFLDSHKIERMAKHVAKELGKQKIFIKEDLPRRMVLGLVTLNVPDAIATSRDFTNHILNEILANLPVLIVNQDLVMGEAAGFQLQSYEAVSTLRIRGAMLGAEHIIYGEMLAHVITPKPNKSEKVYRLDLHVDDIRTKQEQVRLQLTFSENGKLLKDK